MQAIIINRYGGPEVLELATVDRPHIKENELLVKVQATSINPVECAMRRGQLKYLFRLKFPAILGVDVSGEVVEVGATVNNFKVGDAAYAFLRPNVSGAYAEYAAVPAAWTGIKPANLSHTEAAAVPGVGLTALQVLRNTAQLQSGQKVLINGGSGGVGTFAIQIARALNAVVTAVCSTPKVELVKSLGAQRVIDYTQEDFTQDKDRYDVILDCVGNKTFLACRRLLKQYGLYVTVVPRFRQFLHNLLAVLFPGKRSKVFVVEPGKDIDVLTRLIEDGKVKPIIDRIYTLSQIAEAHRYCEQGHTAGKIVVTVRDTGSGL